MLSFELSNGHLYDPRVPTTMDDDQYVEYHLDDLTGIPSNAEEEQRVSQLVGYAYHAYFKFSNKKMNYCFSLTC